MSIKEPKNLSEVWENGCKVEAFYEDGNVTISANPEGLRSLAKLLLFIARDEHEEYYHFHFDKHSGLEDSSNVGLIFQKYTFKKETKQ
jgi:hypothetical protein